MNSPSADLQSDVAAICKFLARMKQFTHADVVERNGWNANAEYDKLRFWRDLVMLACSLPDGLGRVPESCDVLHAIFVEGLLCWHGLFTLPAHRPNLLVQSSKPKPSRFAYSRLFMLLSGALWPGRNRWRPHAIQRS